MNDRCDKLIGLIRRDMKPALGVTEPGAIAFAVAKARGFLKGEILGVELALNSGMYKNAFTCGIPNSDEVGNAFAAALGAVGGRADKGLEALADITPADNLAAQALLDAGKVKVSLSGISPDIYIRASVTTTEGNCAVAIEHAHTDIVSITLDGKVIFEKPAQSQGKEETEAAIHAYGLAEILDCAERAAVDELSFMQAAYTVNLELFQTALDSPRAVFSKQLYKKNGNAIISGSELDTAQLFCNGAIEGRVLGLPKPAMSITGSGAHGIICTLPLYAVCKVNGLSEERLLRATALSYLVTMYIKEYSGRLSAFCGCAIAAGTGMACAVAWLKGAGLRELEGVINNMASSITGMICDGGNQGCAMKGIVAVDAAFRSAELALAGAEIARAHGINGRTPELTMRYMGLIASPGMIQTEKTILDILEEKQQ